MIRRTLVIFVAIVLSLLVWWVGPLIAIGTFYPMVSVLVRGIIIALILTWALWPLVASALGYLFRHFRAPKISNKKSRQRDRVSARFFDAIRTLKYIGIAGQKTLWQRLRYRLRNDYLNEKPWFLIIGPSGSGKTSLVNESGKRFLLSEQYGFTQTADIGPTRDCNLWLTDKAVYIDTAGEWTQLHGLSDEASKAQGRLFSLIRRYRQHPGIDAIVLCLDAHWLLHASLTERKSLADALRARMLEVASYFRNDIAVYLAVNNLDSLSGGSAFLSMMSEEILAQGIGFTIVSDSAGKLDFPQSDAEYSYLLARVSRYVQEMLHSTHSNELRQQLLFFTESLGNLRKPLFNLLEQIVPQSPVGYSAQMRQIWLGSTQVLQLGDSPLTEVEPRPTGQIYSPMLDNAIVERGTLNSRALPLRARIGRTLRYSLVFLLLAFAVNMLVTRYLWEEEYIAYMSASFDETKRMVREIPATNRISDDLISAYEQLGYMNAQLSNSASLMVNPYFEHRLINQQAEQTYHRHLFKFFWPALERYVSEEMERDISSSDADVYNTLKIYLMMGKPEHRSATELENWFLARWSRFAPQGYSDADKRLFGLHLRTIFKESLQSEAPVTKLNPELIRMARVKAMAIPVHVRVLQDLKIKVPSNIENVSLASAAGANVSLMLRRKGQATVTDMAVPAFYTLASYHDVFKPQLNSAVTSMIREEAWVLRDSDGNVDKARALDYGQKLSDEVRKLYLLEYADSWESFLKDVHVRPVSNLDDAALLARQFSDPSSPLANLLRFVTRQTGLSQTDGNDVSGWMSKRRMELENARRDIVGEISGERSRFRITPEKSLEQRFEVVRRLGAQLMQPGGNNDPLARGFEELYNQLSSLAVSLRAGEVMPQNSAISRLRIAAAQQPEPVRSIMLDLLEVGNHQSLQQSRNNLNNSAAIFATDVCKNVLSGRYPFNRRARDEVGIGDFARMFGPAGSMKRYFDQHLAPYVDNTAGKLRIREGSRGLLSASTLKAFESAMLIGDTFFNGGDKVSFSLYLRPLSLSPNIMEAVLDIDGEVIRYSHGSIQPVAVQWPGKNGGAYVRLSFKDMNGKIESVSFNGPWALFHLYDKSNPLQIDRDRRELTMGIASISGFFKMELRSTINDFPLWSRALSQFSCPG